MAQQSNSPHHPSADSEHEHDLSPKRPVRHPDAGRNAIITRAIGQVAVLEVAGPLGEVVEDLDQAIQVALADGPRGVICDLSTAPPDASPGAVEWLAMAGRHVRHWPGIPVAVACPDPLVREALSNHPVGRHLILTASVAPVLSEVLATPIPDVDCLMLTPHPTAPRASRDFVVRALLRWGLGPLIPAASLIVSELVTNSTIHAGTDIKLSVEWNLGLLRLTVRDKSPDLPRQQFPQCLDVHGRGLNVVAALSRAFGVLPTAEGGKAVWAVLNAARPQPSTINGMNRLTAVLEKPSGHSPQTRAELSTCPRTLPTTRDRLSQNVAVTSDQR
jgi:anti-sigma regulatory factor (Ser/Thr protein kinase)